MRTRSDCARPCSSSTGALRLSLPFADANPSALRLPRRDVGVCSVQVFGCQTSGAWTERTGTSGRMTVIPSAGSQPGVCAERTRPALNTDSHCAEQLNDLASRPSRQECTPAGDGRTSPASPETVLIERRAQFGNARPASTDRVGSGLPDPSGMDGLAASKGEPVGIGVVSTATPNIGPASSACVVRSINTASPVPVLPITTCDLLPCANTETALNCEPGQRVIRVVMGVTGSRKGSR